MGHWVKQAVIYHLFPLGCLGAPAANPFTTGTAERLRELHGWLDYLQDLGINTLLLGPLLESSAHGYDVANYFEVDRRLGSVETLREFSRVLHERGMRLVFDAVLHHTGRDFWAFQQVQKNGENSPYRNWYHLDFSGRSPCGDPFVYEGWAGHYDLVKLNLRNAAVREHLFAAVAWWIEQFGVNGLRLDAADRLDPEFRRDLAAYCRSLRPDFWLMGEVVHGDYREWANAEGLCSTTNYELYKALWSSHNDKNYFELAYSLNRQFGSQGIYRGLDLYTFADNHDVNRIASSLDNAAHLYPLHILLFTMPGVPSLYYGSEWGIAGRRTATSDALLRPALCPGAMRDSAPQPALHAVIKRLIAMRLQQSALREGAYTSLHVAHEQLAYQRGEGPGSIVTAVNAAEVASQITITLPGIAEGWLTDLLNEGNCFPITGGRCTLPLDSQWGRVLVVRQ